MWQGARTLLSFVLVLCCVTIVVLQLAAVMTSDESTKTLSIRDAPSPPVPKAISVAEKVSTCSQRATARGPGQRVLSFVFYGQKGGKREYFQGISENAALVSSLYPGWVMRVYHNLAADDPDLPPLEAAYPHLDLCRTTDIPRLGSYKGSQPNAWRFLPLCDPLVDVLVCRDLDSRVSAREKAAVDEWLASGFRYHIMRDHPQHRVPLLAGMWGVRMDLDAKGSEQSPRRFCHKLTRTKAGTKLRDQVLLWVFVWPTMIDDVLQHDSYWCDYYRRHGNMRPWPVRRSNHSLNFEGSRYGVDLEPMVRVCKKSCRPREHQDWTTC